MVATSYGHELRALLALALPSTISTYSFFAISLTQLSVMGHLGVTELAAVSYSQMAMDFSTLVFVQGFNAGMNALCAQAFGAKNYSLLAQYGQLTAATITVMSVPLAILWWNLGSILLLAGVAEEVTMYSTLYSRLWILGMWPRSMFEVQSIFYQAQQIVVPTAVTNLLTVTANFVLATGLTYGTFGLPKLGFIGCPVGTVISMWLRLAVYYYYMHHVRHYDRKSEWKWSRDALNVQALKVLASVGFPLAAGTMFEDAQLQTIALFSAKIGEVQLGTHNSMMELIFFATSPIYGVISGSVVRAGSYLGAGKPHLARMVAQVAGLCIATLCVVNGSVMVIFKGQIGRIFSEDPAVIASFSHIGSLGAFAYMTLGFFYYSMVVLQSQARPLPLMFGFAIGAWLVGVPCSYYLGLKADPVSFFGIWVGMLLGYVVTSAIGFYGAFVRVDWNEQSRLAVERSRAKKTQHRETDPLLPKSHG